MLLQESYVSTNCYCKLTTSIQIVVLGTFEGVLVTGGEDGAIQIRSQVFDPLQAPQKVLDVRLYDGFTGGITSIAVVNGRIYTGGANGVIFCCDTSQCGLRRGKQVSAGKISLTSQYHVQNVCVWLVYGLSFKQQFETQIDVNT